LVSGNPRLWSAHHRGFALVVVLLALVAASCAGDTEVLVDVRAPRLTTIVESKNVPSEATETIAVATVESLNDPLAPGLGNGGYDVASYDLAMEWIPDLARFESTMSVAATATDALPVFHLDFSGSIIRSVEVDGAPAAFHRSESELAVTPPVPIATGAEFVTVVAYLTHPGGPSERSMLAKGDVGWIETSDPAWYTRSLPDGAHTWMPVNDHPSDPAVFRSELTVPEGMTAVASGTFGRLRPGLETLTTQWETSAAIPPHATTVIFGDFDIVGDVSGSDATGIQLRHLLPSDMDGKMPAVLHRVDDMILYLEQRLGPFPYEAWGVAVVADSAPTRPANSWTILSRADLESSDVELRIMRDLTSHYFGHAVGVADWSDVWIGEAIPTYMQWLWLQGNVGRTGLDVTIAAARAKVNNAAWPPPDEPRVGDVYIGGGGLRGALFLHALSLRIGQTDFLDVLATAYRDHVDATLTTEEFIAIASDVSGENIGPFADAWFHRVPLPGFPDG